MAYDLVTSTNQVRPSRRLLTDEGLVAPGATALFHVYVVLTTANEKVSKTVSVTRPG